MNDPIISVENLCFRYPNSGQQTLDGLNFSMNPGEIYGFLGPSGAGKSTTQKILYRLLPDYTGSVTIRGREIRDWDTSVYSIMGIGFETPNLYRKLTGRENLELALALRGETSPRKEIQQAAARLGLGDALDNRVDSYSKGMSMRLAFIRAVLHKPKLLFLDEPTSGLDPLWARQVKDWVLELRDAGTGVFLTTHSMELADELCGTVGFLVDGRLVVQENPGALKQQYGQAGILVHGRDQAGSPVEREISYHELREQTVNGLSDFTEITRVINREVSLEQVFLLLTGRSLQEGAA